MATLTREYSLSLDPNSSKTKIRLSQYDRGYNIVFNLYYKETPYQIPSGATITISGTKKDMTGFIYNCTYSGNKVTFVLADQVTIFGGKLESELTVAVAETRIATANFIFYIEPAPLKNEISVSKTEIPAIQDLINNINSNVSAAATSAKNAATSESNASNSAMSAASSAASIKASADQIAANKKALQTPTTVTDPTSKTVLLAGSQGIDYSKLADAIIAKYTGQTLAGKAQAVKTALDLVKNQTDGIIDVVNGTTTKDYASGDFFQLNNKTYVARTAIASGTALTDSTVTSYATALSESALNSLSNSIAGINETLSSHGTTLYGKPFENVRWSGEKLGSTFTAEQLAYIQNNEGYQLGLGSYWTDEAQGITWRNLDFNFLLRKGDSVLNKYHSLVMPDACLLKANGSSTHYMQDSDDNTTANGYNGTKYRSTYRSQCKTKFANFFGSHVLTHREMLTNASTNGKASGCSWYDCDVELPSEDMIYGSSPWGDSTYGGGSGYNVGINYGRIAGFESHPELINASRETYWLRTICTASLFACVYAAGASRAGAASYAWVGLRPYALIG